MVSCLQGQPRSLQQCLAGSIHSIRPGAGSTFWSWQAASSYEKPEAHLCNPPLWTGWLWRDDKNSVKQRWARTHLYGWIIFVLETSVYSVPSLLLLTELPHVLLWHWRSDTQPTASIQYLVWPASLLYLYWLGGYIHISLLGSFSLPSPLSPLNASQALTTPQEREKALRKQAPCTDSSTADVHKHSVWLLHSPHGHPAGPGIEIDSKGEKAPGLQSVRAQVFLISMKAESCLYFIAAAFRSARTSHAESLLHNLGGLISFIAFLWHFICLKEEVSPLIDSIQCTSHTGNVHLKPSF